MVAEENIQGSDDMSEEDLEAQMAAAVAAEAESGAGDDLEAQMAAAMDGGEDDDDLEAQMAAAMAAEAGEDDDLEAQMAATMVFQNDSDEEELDLDAQMAAAMQDDGEDEIMSGGMRDESVSVKPVSFNQLHASEENIEQDSIDRLLDVSLNLSVELGRKQMQIKEILDLGPGKIIELDKLAGEPVDLLVSGKLLAKGEVVVVDENFGVRITDLINPRDRVRMM